MYKQYCRLGLRGRLNLSAAGFVLAALFAPAAALVAPSEAQAQEQCGAIPGVGPILCGAGQYVDGIVYDVTGDLDVDIDAAAEVLDTVLLTATGDVDLAAAAPLSSIDGSALISTAGDSVSIVGTTVETTADAATAVLVDAGGAVDLTLDGVVSIGDGSGLIAVDASGPIAVTLGTGRSEGDDSTGVELVSLSGPVSLDAGVLETLGDGSTGGLVQAVGLTDVDIGVLRTSGFEAAGLDLSVDAAACALLATGSCDTTFTVDELITQGDYSPGAIVRAAGAINADVGVLRTEGLEAVGLDLGVDPDACVVLGVGACNTDFAVDDLSTDGDGAVGVLVRAAGTVTGDVGVLRTEGDDAIGLDIGLDPEACLLLGAGACDVGLTGDSVTTGGDGAAAVLINGAGDVTANFGALTTRGADAPGLAVLLDPAVCLALGGAACAVDVDTGDVDTGGDGSGGVDVSTPGAVDVDTGDITTGGDGADGVNVDGGDEPIDVSTGDIATGGDDSDGVNVTGEGPITVAAGDISTEGDASDGVVIVGGEGAIDVSTGDISTGGNDSDGVDVTGEGPITIATGDISTEGDASDGVVIVGGEGAIDVSTGAISTSGDDSDGVDVVGEGPITVAAGDITTEGAESEGIIVDGGDGPVTVVAGEISTAGPESEGIDVSSDGVIDVTAGDISTSGEGAEGAVIAGGDGDVTVDLGSVETTGPASDGLIVGTTDGDQTIAVGDVSATGEGSDGIDADSVTGDIAIVVDGAAVADVTGVSATTGGAVSVTVNEGGSVTGGVDGVVSMAGEGTTILNNGMIEGGTGFAIVADGEAADIVNNGVLSGSLDLTDMDDAVTNNGDFLAVGESLFGAGDDLFTNNGVVTPDGPVAFLGLETFVNAGSIDMIDGVADDSLSLPGDYVGEMDASLGVDVALGTAGTPADRLVIAGAATGLTEVTINNIDGGVAVLNPDGVLIVSAGSAADGAFVLAPDSISQGFIDYRLAVEDGEVLLQAAPGGAVFELAKIARFSQQTWQAGADAWSTRMTQVADAERGGRGRASSGETWAQVFGSSLEWNLGGETVIGFDGEEIRNLDFDSERVGFQAGVDWSRGGSMVWGVTTGLSRSEYRFEASPTSFKVKAANLGLYGAWTGGSLRAEALAKVDALSLTYLNPAAPFFEEFDGLATGVQGQVAYRFGGEGFYFEPQAQVSYVHTSLDDLEVPGAAATFEDSDVLEGRVGLRVGSNAGAWRPFVSAHAVRAWGQDERGLFSSGGYDLALSDGGEANYGLFTAGVDSSWRGLESFLQAEAATGDVEGWGARLGVRIRW